MGAALDLPFAVQSSHPVSPDWIHEQICMTHPIQPAWVLLTASANRQNVEMGVNSTHNILKDNALIQARQQNSVDPSSLVQQVPQRCGKASGRFALVLIGELHCFQRSESLLRQLSQEADLYVVTSERFRAVAEDLAPPRQRKIIEDHPKETSVDQNLPVNSMKQWHKLSLALNLIRKHEQIQKQKYQYILKLRSDYFYAHPDKMLSSLVKQCRSPNGGLVGASDKVFGGRRDQMMLMEGLFQAIPLWFDQRETEYWPINLQQVLESDDAIKWFGMNWPKDIVGTPGDPTSWREILREGGQKLAAELAAFRPSPTTEYHRILRGHERFASEICFSRFLNFCGVSFQDCRGLRGFLYNDRKIQA